MPDTATLKKSAAKAIKAGGGGLGLHLASLVTMVPIAKCEIAPENPRFGRDVEDLGALQASIVASLEDGGPGVLQPGICYQVDGKGGPRYLFTAGRRRLSAARAAGLTDLPALIQEKEAAIRAGLQEQANRVNLHPADEAKAFARELVQRDAKAVANAFGVSESHVLRRAALANLVPDVFEAFASDRIDMRQAQAWADAPRERQEATLARVGVEASQYQVRGALQEGVIDGDDRLAIFIGEDVYVAAGGTVVRPLFDEHEEDWDPEDGPYPGPTPQWSNRELAERLAQEKLDAKSEELKKEGYAWTETGPYVDWSRFDRRAATKKGDRAELGCFLELKHDGQLQVHKNLAVTKGGKGGAGAKSNGSAPTPDVGNHSHLTLTTAATYAVRHNLCASPEAALPVLLARMARDHYVDGGYFSSEDEIVGMSTRQHDGAARDIEIHGQKLWDEADVAWRYKLAGDKLETAEVEIAKWTRDEQLKFLAFLVAASVSGVEGTVNAASDLRRMRLAFAGRMSGLGDGPGKVAAADTWTPDAKWFANCSRGHRAELATILDVENTPNTKVGVLCAMLADKAAERGWVPPLMKQLTGSTDVVAATPKKKRGGK